MRKVPEYIAEEACWSKEEGRENEINFSSAIYSELEDFASCGPPGSGWRPLGEVTRYHVIHLLSEAIKERIIGMSNAIRLMYLCLHENAEDEAQILLDSILDHVNTEPNSYQWCHGDPPLKIDFCILDILEDFTILTGRYGHAYQKMAQLLEENRYVSLEQRVLERGVIGEFTTQDDCTAG